MLGYARVGIRHLTAFEKIAIVLEAVLKSKSFLQLDNEEFNFKFDINFFRNSGTH